MGRNHIKLPNHLYISPPASQSSSTSTSTSTSPTSFFSSRSILSYQSTNSLLLRTASTTRAFERRVPGFKTSAAFLSALRANIGLVLDPPDSPPLTPDSIRPLASSHFVSTLPAPPQLHAMSNSRVFSDADLAPPSALKLPKSNTTEPDEDVQVSAPRDPNEIPELKTLSADNEAARIEALRLVADSVAQQRQIANRVILFHPITVGFLVVVLGMLYQNFYKGAASDFAIIGTTFAGVLASILLGIRAKTGGYLEEAEHVGTWKWLAHGRETGTEKTTDTRALGDDGDQILITKFGDDCIGAIIYRGVQSLDDSSSKKSSRKSNLNSQPRTEIRAWTVRRKYRGKGVGTALLEDAIKDAHDRGWAQDGVEIAANHANSKDLLPQIFSGFIQRNDQKTRQFIETKVKEYEEANRSGHGKGKRRR